MKFEVIESDDEWVVQSGGVELARFSEQSAALDDVAVRLKDADPGEDPVSLRVRYKARG